MRRGVRRWILDRVHFPDPGDVMSHAELSLTIRPATAGDAHAVMRLAALDGAPAPRGTLLVAERDGGLIAAVPFEGGRAIADPFEATQDAVALLRLRTRQLGAAVARGRA
jgi:hypothetical protein